MTRALILGLVNLAILAVAGAVLAQQPQTQQTLCTRERDKVLAHLSQTYQEAPTSMGLVGNGSVLEVMTSDTGSWTLTITRPDGLMCIMVSGTGWETFPAPPKPMGTVL